MAASVLAVYSLWITIFEYVIEPALRRSVGFVLRCTIVWAAAGPLRIWAPADPCDTAREAAITAFGNAMVMANALVPAVVVGCTIGSDAYDSALRATSSLMVLPMVAIFVLRIMAMR